MQEKPPAKVAQNLSDFKQQAQNALKISLDDQGLDRHSIKKYLTSASFNASKCKSLVKTTTKWWNKFQIIRLIIR
ncbi:hypothetical protein [Mesomycoplasma ovipneumoniae]|uniref:hypothetical protein n=1 Tax=Mesomycoplasma ovipneumoniae TaxID=29562 RepID=UPI00311ABAD5